MQIPLRGLFVGFLVITSLVVSAQSGDSLQAISYQLGSIEKNSAAFNRKFDKQTSRYLKKLKKQEWKLYKKLYKKDSVLAKRVFGNIDETYASLQNAPTVVSKYKQVYSSKLDSLTTSLNFLQNLSDSSGNFLPGKQLEQFKAFQDKLNQSEKIKNYLKERSKLLKANLEKVGLIKELKGFQKEAYYYSAQIKAYKQLWENPSKMEAKLLEFIRKQPKFQSFFASNSMLGSIFRLPGVDPATAVPGLQTRAGINQQLSSRLGNVSSQQMLVEGLQAGRSDLMALKNKASGLGSGSIGSSKDFEMPKDFKPNQQRTKSFFQRLEYGFNIQTMKGKTFFPVTSDLGLSIGYKINDNSTAGVGASYKLGWGSGWNNINLTNQGIGLRSFVDVRLKGSLFISGGYEQNYKSEFRNIQQLKELSGWQTSGLIGLSKKYMISKKVKGDMKLLWDFLSYQQIPQTQAIVFRIGYTLK